MSIPAGQTALSDEPLRVAVVSTHVIQHFAPMYRRLAQRPGLGLRVFYGSRAGLEKYFDPGLGVEVAWDSDLTSGYDHCFLASALDSTIDESPPRATIESYLKAFDPAVVFVYGYASRLMIRAMMYAVRNSKSVVMMTDSEMVQPRSMFRRAAKAVVLRQLFRYVDAFMTVGDNNEAYLEHYGVPRAKLIRGGLPTDESAFLAIREDRAGIRAETRTAWNVSADAFVALFVGKLIARKRPLDLFDAVVRARALTQRPIVAVYAGDGELREQLNARARDYPECIRMLGFVNQHALPVTYASADVLVQPADRDPHPLTITESNIVGLPVVVSDRVGAVGPTDTARVGENARVFGVGNVEELAQILRELADDRSELARMEAATARVTKETGLDACVDGFVRAVTRAAAKGATGAQRMRQNDGLDRTPAS